MILAFFSGVVLWTMTEYFLHRFLGHEHKGKNFFKSEHVQHHVDVFYYAPAWKKAILAILVCSALLTLLTIAVNGKFALFFTAGFAGMYFLYELTHFRYHARKPVLVFIDFRKHHYYHHFHNPKKNYGVTTRFWDRVFGTFVEVEGAIKIPGKMIPDWMMDAQARELSPVYRKHFSISKR